MTAKTILLVILLSMAVAILSSCGICTKKVDCPGYNDEVLDAWFPYFDKQELIFRNELNERDTFLLHHSKSLPYTQTVPGQSRTCASNSSFQSVEANFPVSAGFYLDLQSGDLGRQVFLRLRSTEIRFEGFKENGSSRVLFSSLIGSSQWMTTATIGNRTFTELMEVKRDTTSSKKDGIYRFFYRKGEGLVAYSEYPSLKTWVKQ
jgi:hypothetical protein